jgi:tetratricopeptide (TPR) repeat protein
MLHNLPGATRGRRSQVRAELGSGPGRALALAALCSVLGMGRADARAVGGAEPARPSSAPAAGHGPTKPASVLPFIEDDFLRARSAALRSGRLLFVDAWALWCHTCLSMRNFVFTDPQLAPLAERLVYLAVDTEQPVNAAFIERFPLRSWPTFLVIDPQAGDTVVARWTGAMTAADLKARLLEVLVGRGAGGLAAADAAAAAGRAAEAAQLYEQAAANPALRSRARLGQIQALRESGSRKECALAGDRFFEEIEASALATDFAAYAADCSEAVPDVDLRQKLRRRLRERLLLRVRETRAALSVDDRSDGFGTLIELSDELGEPGLGDRYAMERLVLLESAAKSAPSPVHAATFDAHRSDAYRRLKRYDEAERMLLGSLRALPGDYNPPARLARLYLEMGRLSEGLTRIEQAIALCSGPRRIGMYELRSSLLHGLGQTTAAVQSLQSALQLVPPSPTGGESAKAQGLRKMIATLASTLPAPATTPPATTPPATTPPAPPTRPTRANKPREERAPSPPPLPLYRPGDPVAVVPAPAEADPAAPPTVDDRGKRLRPPRKVAKRDGTTH